MDCDKAQEIGFAVLDRDDSVTDAEVEDARRHMSWCRSCVEELAEDWIAVNRITCPKPRQEDMARIWEEIRLRLPPPASPKP